MNHFFGGGYVPVGFETKLFSSGTARPFQAVAKVKQELITSTYPSFNKGLKACHTS